MQLTATQAHATSTRSLIEPRSRLAAQLNLSVQELFNTLHLNARTAVEHGGVRFRLTPADIVRGIDQQRVTGNFIVLINSARAVAPDAEQQLAAAEHAVSGLAQLLLGAAADHTTHVDHLQLGTQFLPPFNEHLAQVSRAAQQLEVGSFGW